METISKENENLNTNLQKNNNIPLKSIKKHKGYARFLRNIIKEKSLALKEIIQKRFFQWRKDALKGKIKKTIMVRISVSREKEPKHKYQMDKVKPKQQSNSVNKNNLKKFDINKIPKRVNNLKIKKRDNLGRDNSMDKNKSRNKKILDNKIIINKNKERNNEKKTFKKKIKNSHNKENVTNNIIKDNNIKDKRRIIITNKNKIKIDKNLIPKINQKINRINQIYISSNRKQNKNNLTNNKNSFVKINKIPITNNNNVTIKYSSSTKKNNLYDSKYLKEKNNMTERNCRLKTNPSELRNKTPILYNKNNSSFYKPINSPIDSIHINSIHKL